MTTTNQADFYFPVEVIDNEHKTNPEYSKIIKANIKGYEWHLNYCSPRYELVKNEDIFPNIEDVLSSNNISYEASYKMINRVRFYADYILNDDDFLHTIEGTNDKIYPKLSVQHSYNGMTKYAINFGYFRLICSNGLVIPIQEMKKYNLSIIGKHTAQILSSFNKLDEMLNKFVDKKQQIGLAITAKYKQLTDVWVTKPEDRLKEILEGTKIRAVENKNFNTVDHIMNIVIGEANNQDLGYGGKINDWLIYNGINQYINDDDRYKSAPETRAKKDQEVLSFML